MRMTPNRFVDACLSPYILGQAFCEKFLFLKPFLMKQSNWIMFPYEDVASCFLLDWRSVQHCFPSTSFLSAVHFMESFAFSLVQCLSFVVMHRISVGSGDLCSGSSVRLLYTLHPECHHLELGHLSFLNLRYCSYWSWNKVDCCLFYLSLWIFG